jgi:hypothetical protein
LTVGLQKLDEIFARAGAGRYPHTLIWPACMTRSARRAT